MLILFREDRMQSCRSYDTDSLGNGVKIFWCVVSDDSVRSKTHQSEGLLNLITPIPEQNQKEMPFMVSLIQFNCQ